MSSSVLAKEIAEEIAEILFRTAHLISDKLDSECIALIDQKLSGVREAVEKIANYTDWTKEPYTVENVEALRKEAETLKIDNVPNSKGD